MRRVRQLLLATLTLGAAPALLAHTGARPPDAPWWTLWNADPLVIGSLGWIGAVYAVGYRLLRAQRGQAAPVRPWQAAAFAAGVAGLVLALLSPIDALALDLLWVHMVQHMLLMNVAAPLFVLGAPARAMLWVLPPGARQWFGRGPRRLARVGLPRYALWQPVLLWIVYAAVLWVWHLPRLYEAAVTSEPVHDLQHIMFFAVSCLFWRVLFDPIGRLRMSRALAVMYLFATSLHATLLGVFMALAPRLWYPVYAGRTTAWGLAPLEDQQLAGYIMWMPACMVYAAIAAILFSRWLAEESHPSPAKPLRAQRADVR